MPTTCYRDRLGRSYDLRIDERAIERVAELGIDVDLRRLLVPTNGELGALLQDGNKLAKVWWAIALPQVERHGVAPADFGRSFDGDSLLAAGRAFVESLILLCPAGANRKAARRWLGNYENALR